MKRLFVLATLLAAACGDNAKVSDITVVRAYIVACDSVTAISLCLGPSHRAGFEDFTVIISKREVRRNHLIYTFHDCEVLAPRHWDCLDIKNNLVQMRDYDMKWDELTEAHQVAVYKSTYCLADEEKGKGATKRSQLSCLF